MTPEQQIARLRQLKEEVGLLEAKKIIRRESILSALDDCRDFYHLRALVRTIAEAVL